MEYILTVTMMADAESGVIDSLQGRGYEICLESEEDDTGVYSLTCEREDLPQIRRILNDRDDVISYKFSSAGPSGEARVSAIRNAAIQFVQASGVDVTNRVDILALAKPFAKQEECTVKTAKLRIAEAVRRMRHPDWKAPERGGSRPGAGRPPQ